MDYPEICSISELYEFFENNALELRYDSLFPRVIHKFLQKTTDEHVKKQLQYEIYFFDFILENGKIEPLNRYTNEDGKEIVFPSLDLFTDETYAYLYRRISECKNSFLKIRYNQILWNSKLKSIENAKNCIDNSLIVLKVIDCHSKQNELACIDLFYNGCDLAIEVKYKIDDFKKIACQFLFDKNRCQNYQQIEILKFMVNNPKIFKKDDFIDTLDLCMAVNKQLRLKNHIWLGNEICEIAIRIASKLSLDDKIWKEEIAKNYESFASYRMDDESKMIPLNNLKSALHYYQKAKNKAKIEEIGLKYNALKKELKLTKVQIPLDENLLKILSKYHRARVNKLLNMESNQIFQYLATGEDIFPTVKVLEDMALGNNNSSLDIFSKIEFDINKNIGKSHKTDTEKFKDKLFDCYRQYYRISINYYLQEIFIDGIKANKISFPHFVNYLKDHSWLGQNLEETNSAGEVIPYSWLSLIAPSISDYFSQVDTAIKYQYYEPNGVLCIDSLTLKIEGILRDLAKRFDINTIVSSKDGGTREMFTEDLLANEKMQQLLGENDILLLKFAFTSAGLNLRNNIAHNFYRFQNYSLHYMHLLIVVVLRLGRFRLNQTQ